MKTKLLLAAMALLLQTYTHAQSQEYELEELVDISYYNNGTEDSLLTKVNFVLPKGVDNPPVLMWLGGGAWSYVNRHQEMNLARNIARQGIAVISVGHRLSPALLEGRPKRETGIQHPEHIKDVAMALAWIHKNEGKYNYDVNNIFVGGFSCGGHLAALIAADMSYLAHLGLSTEIIRGIIPVAGGYDIPRYKTLLAEEDPNYIPTHINPVFGESHEAHVHASPLTYVENLTMPILIMNESETYSYNGSFEEEILKNGNKTLQVMNFFDHGHASLWRELSNEKPCASRDVILEFIRKYRVQAVTP